MMHQMPSASPSSLPVLAVPNERPRALHRNRHRSAASSEPAVTKGGGAVKLHPARLLACRRRVALPLVVRFLILISPPLSAEAVRIQASAAKFAAEREGHLDTIPTRMPWYLVPSASCLGSSPSLSV
jgi:hypothetical protein